MPEILEKLDAIEKLLAYQNTLLETIFLEKDTRTFKINQAVNLIKSQVGRIPGLNDNPEIKKFMEDIFKLE